MIVVIAVLLSSLGSSWLIGLVSACVILQVEHWARCGSQGLPYSVAGCLSALKHSFPSSVSTLPLLPGHQAHQISVLQWPQGQAELRHLNSRPEQFQLRVPRRKELDLVHFCIFKNVRWVKGQLAQPLAQPLHCRPRAGEFSWMQVSRHCWPGLYSGVANLDLALGFRTRLSLHAIPGGCFIHASKP